MRNSWKKIAALTAAAVTGLATAAHADLWGIAYGDNILVRINPQTAEATFVAFLNGDYSTVDFSGLDYMNGTLYANGIYNPVEDDYGLVSIDTVTGATTLLNFDPGACYALAGDPLLNRLYTYSDDDIEGFDGTFWDYDANDGYSLNLYGIPSPPVDWIDGAAFGLGLFWGVDSDSQSLYSINVLTGDLVFRGVVSVSISDNAGLAWDDGVLYLASADANDLSSLYTLDPFTAEATLVGQITESGDGLTIDGLAGTIPTFAPAPEPTTGYLALPALVGIGIVARQRFCKG